MKSAKSAPKSNIDTILDKLEPNVHTQLFGSASKHEPNVIRRRATLIANGEEALRILSTKRASFMPKNKDTPLVRAALVIEYLSRNAPNNNTTRITSSSSSTNNSNYMRTTIPVPLLAKSIGITTKKDIKKLETMMMVMASYLDGTSIGGRKQAAAGRNKRNDNNQTTQLKRKRDEDNEMASSAASNYSGNATIASTATSSSGPIMLTPTDLIRDLCIQLGPLIPDAEFAAAYAFKLFKVLQLQSRTTQQSKHQSSTKQRRFSMYELRRDMERNQEYYEATCFYLAVKKSEGESSIKQTAAAAATAKAAAAKKKKGGKSSTKKKGNEGIDSSQALEEDEDDKIDNEDDDRPLTEMDVIHAGNLLESTFKDVRDWTESITEGILISLDSLSAGKNKIGSTDGATTKTKTLFEVKDKKKKDGNDKKAKPIYVDFAFEQWKQKVLLDTKASVEEKNTNEKEGSADWLTLAANEVLRQAELNNVE